MQRVQYKMYVDDFGWLDCCHVGPMIPSEEPEEEPEKSLNQFELMGYSHEASVILQESYESTKALWECFADAFVTIARDIMKPIEDCFYELFRTFDYELDKKHFDGAYSKPKMKEYFKMQPNICNLNNKIRKVRNLL